MSSTPIPARDPVSSRPIEVVIGLDPLEDGLDQRARAIARLRDYVIVEIGHKPGLVGVVARGIETILVSDVVVADGGFTLTSTVAQSPVRESTTLTIGAYEFNLIDEAIRSASFDRAVTLTMQGLSAAIHKNLTRQAPGAGLDAIEVQDLRAMQSADLVDTLDRKADPLTIQARKPKLRSRG